jgi:cob(I)alamin adenosyltransferase
MSDTGKQAPDSGKGAEIVRFPAAQDPHRAEGRRGQAAARNRHDKSRDGRMTAADPEYWLDKARAFRHIALTSARNDEAAILIRRAEEFERMAAVMTEEQRPQPQPSITAPVERLRDTAEQVRARPPEMPLPPLPEGGVAFAGVPAAAIAPSPAPRTYIARRAQRLVASAPAAEPRRTIARRAQRLVRD